MLNVIRIKKIVFYAYHGVLSEEQNIGGKFEADVDLYTNFVEAAKTDNLKFTVDYHKVYKFVNRVVQEKKYFLIETLAVKIADGVLNEFPLVEKISVRIRKNSAPVGGLIEHVEAEVVKERNEV